MLADLRSVLMADGTVSGLVANARIYPDQWPQSPTFPAAMYFVVSEGNGLTMRGPQGIVQTRVQIDSMGNNKADAESLALAIKTKLHGFSGLQGSTFFQSIEADTARTRFDPDVKRYVRQQDFLIWHEG